MTDGQLLCRALPFFFWRVGVYISQKNEFARLRSRDVDRVVMVSALSYISDPMGFVPREFNPHTSHQSFLPFDALRERNLSSMLSE